MNHPLRRKSLELLLLTALVWPCVRPAVARAQDLVFAADEWCPYNCESDAELPGLVVEVIAEVFAAEGLTTGYLVMPWARAIEEARGGAFAGIIGAGRPEAPDFIYPATPAFVSCDAFYVAGESAWRFEGLESLQNRRLGVIKDYSYGSLFDDYIFDHQNDQARIFVATGEAPLPRLVQMLQAGRVDVVVEDRNVMAWLVAGHDGPLPLLEAGVYSRENIYVAFSPADPRSPHLAALYDRGVAALRESGRLAELLARYGMGEPAVALRKGP